VKGRLGWVLLMVVVVTPVSSGAADAEPIGLSTDGSAFSPGLDRPLFDPSVTWVPGDARASTFHVRNQGGSAARMTIDVLAGQPSELLDSGDLVVTVSSSDGQSLLEEQDVAAGEIVPVTVRVAYSSSSTNTTQLLVNDLDLRVTLTQAAAPVDLRSIATTGSGHGGLPATGAPTVVVPALLAVLCLATGAVLIARRHDNEGASHG